MKIDTTWLRRKFDMLNKKYFDGRVRPVRMRVGHARTIMGSYRYSLNDEGPYDEVITLSDAYKQTAKQYENTLLHEMIHAYLAQHNEATNEKSHGKTFMNWARRINEQKEHLVQVSEKSTLELTDRTKLENELKRLCSEHDFLEGRARILYRGSGEVAAADYRARAGRCLSEIVRVRKKLRALV